jgi:hypothetical protein
MSTRVTGEGGSRRLTLAVLLMALAAPACSEEGGGQADGKPPADAAADQQAAPDTAAPDLSVDLRPGTDTRLADQRAPDAAPVDLPAADLPAADLPAADLPAADLPAADLPAADLPAADLPVADLRVADRSLGEAPPATDGSTGPSLIFTTGGNTAIRGSTTGGTAYYETCPTGQVLVGFYGEIRSGTTYHGKIGARCGAASLKPASGGGYTVVVGSGMTFPLHGKYGGGGSWTRSCGTDQMIVGFRGRAGLLIDQLIFACAPLVVSGSAGAWKVSRGTVTYLPAIGGTGGTAFPQTDCPAGQVARVSRVRAGDSLDGIGLGCATPAIR